MKSEALSHVYLTHSLLSQPTVHSLGKYLWNTSCVSIQEPKSWDAKIHAVVQQIFIEHLLCAGHCLSIGIEHGGKLPALMELTEYETSTQGSKGQLQ